MAPLAIALFFCADEFSLRNEFRFTSPSLRGRAIAIGENLTRSLAEAILRDARLWAGSCRLRGEAADVHRGFS